MPPLGRPIHLPNLAKLGLFAACEQASNVDLSYPNRPQSQSAFGYMQEISLGKDTPSGHWEMAGVPVLFEWGYFNEKSNSFPQKLLDELIAKTGVSGTLANQHSPGTDVLVNFGEQHIQSLQPICYTSVDSVFQIAAHEQHFGLQKLYDFCEVARELLDEYNIGRVIARPFIGETASTFKRTGHRRDYSVLPPQKTLLDNHYGQGGEVISIGKIADIFAHQGISQSIKASGLTALLDETYQQITIAKDNSIVFTNLVNFDQDFGHRRNIEGYAKALEYFDMRLSEMLAAFKQDDYLFITADHGCDPSWAGTDHTREYVPILAYNPNYFTKGLNINLGHRASFADMAQTIAELLDLEEMAYGKSFCHRLI